jgi:hypothetical protein
MLDMGINRVNIGFDIKDDKVDHQQLWVNHAKRRVNAINHDHRAFHRQDLGCILLILCIYIYTLYSWRIELSSYRPNKSPHIH